MPGGKRIDSLDELHKRFWSNVNAKGYNDCWEWTKSRNRKGYGDFVSAAVWGMPRSAHRFAWMSIYGVIFSGYELDHLCRNPPCCNPSHLRRVPLGFNLKQGQEAQIKQFCVNGHERTPENICPKSYECRECGRIRTREWRKRQKEIANV